MLLTEAVGGGGLLYTVPAPLPPLLDAPECSLRPTLPAAPYAAYDSTPLPYRFSAVPAVILVSAAPRAATAAPAAGRGVPSLRSHDQG